jgi:uncharacterized protein (DUF2062 family)
MKEILKKYSPKRENVNLGWLNKYLADPELWKWNKRTIAKAFAIGLFCAFLPIPGHTVLGAVLAVIFSANILLSMLLVWVNNPITMVPIFISLINWVLQLWGLKWIQALSFHFHT